MDLFESLVPRERLHKNFSYISESGAHPAARRLLQKTFELLPKPDGNFVLDFQTSGFDARIWELYLAAFFHSVGLSIAQPHDRPDFLLSCPKGEVWVESSFSSSWLATTTISLNPRSKYSFKNQLIVYHLSCKFKP
ncbi:MAG: hypothetical protein ABSE40_15250 [Candidatus Sulfotelmatobacter sp.]|jgi:hypothetical protein